MNKKCMVSLELGCSLFSTQLIATASERLVPSIFEAGQSLSERSISFEECRRDKSEHDLSQHENVPGCQESIP